jgi:APA family basic amino acid/polyamine antiporter
MSEKNKISIPVATAVGLGAIIGAGIFLLSGTVIALAGIYSLVALVFVGIISIIIALEFGELSSMMPKLKGASYSYVRKAFGSELGFITGIMLYFSYVTAVSAISLGFGAYFASILGISSSFAIYFAIILIAIISIINLLGVKKAAKADFWLVAVKLLILIGFVAFALWYAFNNGNLTVTWISQSIGSFSIISIFAASVTIFFAYTGFQTISTFANDIKGGNKSAAKAILYAVIISIIVYILIDFALMAIVPTSKFVINADPLSFALKYIHASSYVVFIIDLGAIIATISASLAMLLSSSRIMYQISADHLLPSFFRKYNPKRDAASNAIILSAVIAIAMLILLNANIYTIATVSNFGTIFSYIMASFALIHFRRLNKKGAFQIPLYPYLSLLGIIGLMSLMYGMPKDALVIGILMILGLIIIYYSFREVELKKAVNIKLFN